MPLPRSGAVVAVVSLAAKLLFGPTAPLNHLPAVAGLATAIVTGIDALLLHRGFNFLAGLGTHVLHPLAHIRSFLAVDLVFDVDLPQPWFHRRFSLSLRAMCCERECAGDY